MSCRPYTKEWLEELCASSYSYAEVLRKAGRAQAGGSQSTLKKKIAEFNIDVSHFTGQRWQHAPEFQKKYLPENLFVENCTINPTTIRRYIILYKAIEYKCSVCGCDGNWQGGQLALQLHHIDGNTSNNTLSNLTFLCPNCHAITDNYGGKKNIGQERID